MSEDLCRKLKAARAKTGLSQSQFAKRINIPVRTLQRWEQNQSTPHSFALNALNEKLDQILAG
ncbi:MAG: helix-turn-helix domain-containing protein [Verrucomicrobiota bacterium]